MMNTKQICRSFVLIVGLVAWFVLLTSIVKADERPDITQDLKNGHLSSAEKSLTKFLSTNPKDDLARFQLGSVEFFAAIQGLAQDSYRYGLKPNVGAIPFLRTPVKQNPQPNPVTYNDVRNMVSTFVERLEHAEATLEPVTDPNLSWNLDITEVRLDMDGDGKADADETLWSVFDGITHVRMFGGQDREKPPGNFVIGFDSGDVHWLRGYCHLLAALGDMILAYDEQRSFDRTAQLFFWEPQTPYAKVLVRTKGPEPYSPWNEAEISDMIAFIHLANFPLTEPGRLAKAREHLLGMIQASRKSWELIEAETDNNREWIPGPNQTSVVPGVSITKERLAAWRRFLDEADDLLNGKKLIPFWRGNSESGKGINLMKVFTEPKDFDLVLWVQGTDAVPYLEEGELTSPQTWTEFQRVFQGNFIGMAIWIN